MPMPLTTIPDRPAREQALARTYPGDPDGWARVEEFREVMAWHDANPDRGSRAANTATGVPRSRIKNWFTGAKPDPVNAIETASELGWLDATPGSRIFEALAVLNAWIFAGGSITSQTWQVQFSVGPTDPVDLLHDALEAVGIGATTKRPGETTDYSPASHEVLLGRFLHAVLDAPVGQKAGGEIAVPLWLDAVPEVTRRRWAQTYVSLRAVSGEKTHGFDAIIRETNRPTDYHETLAALFGALMPDSATIRVGTEALLFNQAAFDALNVAPELPAE